ncbi:hypothetical protein B7755_043410 [Streptomyces sp. NBS 14/10]|uniref:hypothetical protein n=1 Tax=Streptomyces sp. NBS 14/10 TaxID=1945643 RepID=UPI00211ADEAD|nr:hypothetical protein [Streptomyces sp. NBS 14/10]KAK1184357.1 hypothetical protein B7755_043410 [Streptomyces sp. NBS 14/10]
MVLAAVGTGVVAQSLTLLSLAHSPADKQGYASGAMQTSQNLGQNLVMGAVSAASTSQMPAFTGAFTLLILPIAGAVCLAGRTRIVVANQQRASRLSVATANVEAGKGA